MWNLEAVKHNDKHFASFSLFYFPSFLMKSALSRFFNYILYTQGPPKHHNSIFFFKNDLIFKIELFLVLYSYRLHKAVLSITVWSLLNSSPQKKESRKVSYKGLKATGNKRTQERLTSVEK